jgi:hypothetical protein
MVEIFDAARFADNFALLLTQNQYFIDKISAAKSPDVSFGLSALTAAMLREKAVALESLLAAVGLDVSAGIVGDIVTAIDGGEIKPDGSIVFYGQSLNNLRGSLSEMSTSIPRDLRSRTVMFLSRRDAELFNPVQPNFGEEVFTAFSNAREDIEEAGKCLGLGRPTACVFHLMRALESAAQVIADKIGATIKHVNGKGLPWGVIADNMKQKIDAMTKGSDDQIKWYRVQHNLVVVNRAWRVPTSHPKETYTIDQSREVFNATKAFMRGLAGLA